MEIGNLIKFCIIFFLGFLSANLVSYYLIYGVEIPFSNGFGSENTEKTPFDFVKEEDIQIYEDRIVINVEGASLGRYAPTGSMIPVLDSGSNGIRIKPESEEDIHIGDIITFNKDDKLIIHRVVNISSDDEGVYFITKGDNNPITDGKVRFKDIKYVTIGVIY